MDTRERNAEAEARELTYSFLSHLFLEEVSEDFLARLVYGGQPWRKQLPETH